MAKRGKRGDLRVRAQEAAERAAYGQSQALGDTGGRDIAVAPDRQGISNRKADRNDNQSDENDPEQPGANTDIQAGRTTEADEVPLAEAGAPPVQEQERRSLDDRSQSGRSRD